MRASTNSKATGPGATTCAGHDEFELQRELALGNIYRYQWIDSAINNDQLLPSTRYYGGTVPIDRRRNTKTQ